MTTTTEEIKYEDDKFPLQSLADEPLRMIFQYLGPEEKRALRINRRLFIIEQRARMKHTYETLSFNQTRGGIMMSYDAGKEAEIPLSQLLFECHALCRDTTKIKKVTFTTPDVKCSPNPTINVLKALAKIPITIFTMRTGQTNMRFPSIIAKYLQRIECNTMHIVNQTLNAHDAVKVFANKAEMTVAMNVQINDSGLTFILNHFRAFEPSKVLKSIRITMVMHGALSSFLRRFGAYNGAAFTLIPSDVHVDVHYRQVNNMKVMVIIDHRYQFGITVSRNIDGIHDIGFYPNNRNA